MPNGPGNSFFDTLADSPLSDLNSSGIISYDYTLNNQGLNIDVNCAYAPESPINVFPFPGDTTNLLIQYNGTCDGIGETHFLPDDTPFTALNSTNGLAFWACKSPPGEPELSYFIYMRGLQDYATDIGNITCTISPIQLAIFPVMYQSTDENFDIAQSIKNNTATFSGFLDKSVEVIGNLVLVGQSQQDNLVAQSAFTFGAKYFGLPESENTLYPAIYAVMIEGIMEYLVRLFCLTLGLTYP